MPKTTTITVWLMPELSDKLEVLARIKAALAEARSGAPGVPHSEVARWVESWGTEHERRRPKPREAK